MRNLKLCVAADWMIWSQTSIGKWTLAGLVLAGMALGAYVEAAELQWAADSAYIVRGERTKVFCSAQKPLRIVVSQLPNGSTLSVKSTINRAVDREIPIRETGRAEIALAYSTVVPTKDADLLTLTCRNDKTVVSTAQILVYPVLVVLAPVRGSRDLAREWVDVGESKLTEGRELRYEVSPWDEALRESLEFGVALSWYCEPDLTLSCRKPEDGRGRIDIRAGTQDPGMVAVSAWLRKEVNIECARRFVVYIQSESRRLKIDAPSPEEVREASLALERLFPIPRDERASRAFGRLDGLLRKCRIPCLAQALGLLSEEDKQGMRRFFGRESFDEREDDCVLLLSELAIRIAPATDSKRMESGKP